MNKIEVDQGSFRDPAGKVLYYNDRVLRLLNKDGVDRFNFLNENNLLDSCISNKFLVKSNKINSDNINLNNLDTFFSKN